ncbi:hypothetical protein J2T02_001643 [Chitinophaga terrae (ex Kim and Jung 2007)]|nr:hypothetical protein [Chitinophaga terrae (ex Kim and Jung 2007)]
MKPFYTPANRYQPLLKGEFNQCKELWNWLV